MIQKKSELTPMDIKLLWYKDLWLKYLSMCEVDYYNDERMRLEYLCNLILDDLMRPEYKQVNLNVFPHSRVKPSQTENDGADMSLIYRVNQINPLSVKEKKALFELLYGYMTEETEEMHRLEDEVPDLYKSLINDMINFEMIRRSYRYICTALDKDIVKGDVNDGQ